MLFSNEDFNAVEKAIRNRRTFKVLRDPKHPVQFEDSQIDVCQERVRTSVAAADWAPFHYDRCSGGVPQPWRVDILWHDACQKIAGNFYDWFTDIKPGNKIPAMLSACGACVVVSWLPQFDSESDDAITKTKQRQIDEEHLAAASAYVQNLLLLLTAANMGTYWSSGGQLREPAMQEKVGLTKGRLVAAVFVEFPPSASPNTSQAAEDVERLPGKLADKRAPSNRWCQEISKANF